MEIMFSLKETDTIMTDSDKYYKDNARVYRDGRVYREGDTWPET